MVNSSGAIGTTARTQRSGEVLLPGDALHHLGSGSASDAAGVRRAGHRPGPAPIEKGGGRVDKPSAPPTFSTFAGTTPRTIAAEFQALRKLKPNLGKAAAHLILSPGPDDRTLTNQEWKTALEIALSAHGASEAPYAAYLHSDTDHQHLHVFYSRITFAGEVISDSQSYQKNRSATQKITQELRLTPLPTTPNPTSAGDRVALDNATRSAERRGDALVDAAQVRDALERAQTLDDFKQQLTDVGIEAKFPTRGAKNEIFGFSVRLAGSETWLKASTLAKDLSWPKISHRFPESDRFAESNTAKQSPTEQPTILAANVVTAAPIQQQKDLDRPPQQLQQIPQAVYASNQMSAPGPVVRRLGEVSERLDEMAPAMNTSFLNCAWALSKVAVMCATAAANIAAALWRFIQRLLSLFGLKTSQPLQYSEQSVTPQLTYEPIHHGRVLESDELESLDKNAASAIDHVLECVKLGRPDDLPEDVEGRAELVAAMASTAKTGTPAAAQADSLDALFNDHVTAPAPKIEPVPAQPDTFVLLNMAKGEFFTASIAKSDAREKETPQVQAARKNHELAVNKLRQAKLNYLREKERKGRWAFLLPAESLVIEEEQTELAQAEKNLASTLGKHPTVVPQELMKKFDAAFEKVRLAAGQHHARMVKDVDQYKHVKVKKIALDQAQSFAAQMYVLERARTIDSVNAAFLVAQSAPDSISTAIALAEKESELQAQRNDYVPDTEVKNDDDQPGQQ